jgi:hypothetical protein
MLLQSTTATLLHKHNPYQHLPHSLHSHILTAATSAATCHTQAEKYKGEDEQQAKKIEAKNGLENYAYSMRNTIRDDKVAEKLPGDDKAKIEHAVEDVLKWLESNQLAEGEDPCIYLYLHMFCLCCGVTQRGSMRVVLPRVGKLSMVCAWPWLLRSHDSKNPVLCALNLCWYHTVATR